jgi:hypothetical protein
LLPHIADIAKLTEEAVARIDSNSCATNRATLSLKVRTKGLKASLRFKTRFALLEIRQLRAGSLLIGETPDVVRAIREPSLTALPFFSRATDH